MTGWLGRGYRLEPEMDGMHFGQSRADTSDGFQTASFAVVPQIGLGAIATM